MTYPSSPTPQSVPKVMVAAPRRFLALDALRGVAALLIVDFHLHAYLRGPWLLHGYLAVDFFFMLSGFVLSFAYQQKLDAGYPTASFLKQRLSRLYPLYFAGLLLGMLAPLPIYRRMSLHRPGEYLALVVLGTLMLPIPPIGVDATLDAFPFNLPMWSLFFEVMANLGHALWLRRRSWKVLAAIAALAGSLAAFQVVRSGTFIYGVERSQTLSALPRVALSYVAGMLLFRLWTSVRLRWRAPVVLLPVLFLGCVWLAQLLAAHLPRHGGGFADLAVVMLLFPLVVLAGAFAKPPQALAGLCARLGAVSYALYAIHMPVRRLLERYWPRWRTHSLEQDAPWSGLVCFALTVFLALALDRFFDSRVRTFLRSRLLDRHKTMAVSRPAA